MISVSRFIIRFSFSNTNENILFKVIEEGRHGKEKKEKEN